MNFAPKLVGVATAIPTPEYDETLGDTGWYIAGPTYWVQDLPQKDLLWGDRASFVEEYTEQSGQEAVDYHVPMAASAGEVLQYGIQESGSVDPGEIAQTLHDAEGIDTLFGTLSFTETGMARGISLAQLQRYDDKVNVIWPEEYADQLVYPMPPWSER